MYRQSSDGLAVNPEINPRGGAAAKTVVLIGKTGGTSATGNSIIGRQVFDLMPSLGGVTSTCKMETTVLDDGQILNVVDTPGLFDSAVETHEMDKVIGECINKANDGIHAFLLVLPAESLFLEKEASAFESLCQFFGGNIADYMIVVFADDLRLFLSLNQFIDMLAPNYRKPLKSTLEKCGNRRVLLHNKTIDLGKRHRQREELLSLVEAVVRNNGGKPYTNDLFDELKKGEMNLFDQSVERKSSKMKLHASSEEQFGGLIEMVELRVKESVHNLEKQLAEERVARMEADVKWHVLQTKSNNEVEAMLKERICNLEKQLGEERAARRVAMLQLQTKSKADALEMKNCAEESRKQQHKDRSHRVESINNLEKHLAAERASRLESETKSKDEVLELKERLNRAEESGKQLEERLHTVESEMEKVLTSLIRIRAITIKELHKGK